MASSRWKEGESGNTVGRKPGGKDKRRHYKTVRDQLEAAGFDPIETMIQIAKEENHPVQTRRQATKDLMDKAYPDLKAIEIQSDDKALEDMVQLKKEMKDLLVEHIREY